MVAISPQRDVGYRSTKILIDAAMSSTRSKLHSYCFSMYFFGPSAGSGLFEPNKPRILSHVVLA